MSGLCPSPADLLQLRRVLEVRMAERDCVRRLLEGMHRLRQLGAAGRKLFMRQFRAVFLSSLPSEWSRLRAWPCMLDTFLLTWTTLARREPGA